MSARSPARRRAASCAALSLLLLAAPPRTASAAGDGDATARALFVEGAKLGNQGRWSEAMERYAASLRLRPAPLTRYSLGVAQRETGHFADALGSFRAFLAEPPTTATMPYVQPAQAATTALRAQVGSLSLALEPAAIEGLTLTLDGQAMDLAPPRDIDPGLHDLVARAPGFHESKTRFRATAGIVTVLLLTLHPGAGTEPGPSVRPSSPRPVLPLVLLGTGSAFVVTGAVVGGLALKQASEAPTRGGAAAHGAQSRAIAADVLLGAGLVTLGVGVVLLLTRGRPAPTQTGTIQVSMGEAGSGPILRF